MKIDGDFELYEAVPWDSLVTDDVRRRRRWIYLISAVLVAGAIAAAIGRSIPVDPTAGVAPGTTVPVDATTVAAGDAPLLEADLRADGDRTAVAVATWFVADYFTLDGTETTREALRGLLPVGVDLPEPNPGARSFVESVVAYEVEDLGTGRHRVSLVVRALVSADGEGYRREPARGVELVVAVSGSGVTVLDLPRPGPLPAGEGLEWELEPQDAPEAVLAGFAAVATDWGAGEPVSAWTDGDLWRLVFLAGGSGGLNWPLAAWFDETGRLVDPPVG